MSDGSLVVYKGVGVVGEFGRGESGKIVPDRIFSGMIVYDVGATPTNEPNESPTSRIDATLKTTLVDKNDVGL